MQRRNVKLIAALLAGVGLAAAGPASAAIATAGSGDGNLFLNVYDDTAKVSYVHDLGYTVSSFLPGVANASTSHTINLAADPLWGSFLSQVDPAGLRWNVVAGDSVPTSGTLLGQQYLSTSAAPLATVKTQTNTNLGQFKSMDTSYLNIVNGLGTNPTLTDGSAIATLADNGGGYFGSGFTPNWPASKAVFDSTGAIGTSLNFFYLTPSSNSGLSKATVTEYGNAIGPSTWLLSSNGQLSYSVAAVPEPGTWALLTAGLLAVGVIARRRVG